MSSSSPSTPTLVGLVFCPAGKVDFNLLEETYIVTVKKGADGRIFFQQDYNTVLYPVSPEFRFGYKFIF